MKNSIKALFLSLSIVPNMTHAETVSDSFTPISDHFVIHDLECLVDSKVNNKDPEQCTYDVPQFLFEHMCVDPNQPYHTKRRVRHCILKGLKKA